MVSKSRSYSSAVPKANVFDDGVTAVLGGILKITANSGINLVAAGIMVLDTEEVAGGSQRAAGVAGIHVKRVDIQCREPAPRLVMWNELSLAPPLLFEFRLEVDPESMITVIGRWFVPVSTVLSSIPVLFPGSP